ncbi:MAG TPA: Gfo/Idh/MocA family oxidoreductase [Aestuariivirga sp.]
MTYKIAILGLGKIAMDQHIPAITKNKKFKLVAGVSRNASLKDVPHFTSLSGLLTSKIKLDCLAICTPPSVRLQMALEALKAGLDVLIEKPPTPTMGELFAMQAFARKQKRVLYATWHSRMNAAVEEARVRLKGKRVTQLKITWREDVRHWHPGQEWIWQAGGFGVFDPGINALSILTRIMPQELFVQSAVLETPANKATPIAAQIKFKHADGLASDLSADFDWRQTGEQTWKIEMTTQDGMKLNLLKGGTVLEINGKTILEAPMEEYELIYKHFAKLLKDRKSDVDAAPLQLVCDCFMLGQPKQAAEFL